jgi:transcriptional regulator with XRE-family HTH domain
MGDKYSLPVPKAVNIKSFLPQREIELCARVRELRLVRKMEQAELAEILGITRSRLSSYEYAKAPIRYELGKEICYRLGISQRWLATGDGPQSPYFDVSPNLEFKIQPKTLFSMAFDKVLRPYIEERERELREFCGEDVFNAGAVGGEALDNFHLVGDSPAKAAAFYVRKAVMFRLQWLPPELQIEYAMGIIEADKKFQKKFGKKLASLLPPSQRAAEFPAPLKNPTPLEKLKAAFGENDLTQVSLKRKTDSVTEIQRLIKDAKAKLSQPGAKSALAKEIGVAPARISEWLSGEKEPSGQYALQLYNWVYDLKPKN